jgi:hypothetical protein
VRLELDQPRTFGELVQTTFRLLRAHLALFLSLTLIVVAPVVIAVDGVWGGALAHAAQVPEDRVGPLLASLLVSAFVIPPLVNAMLVTAVVRLGRGEEPTVADALRAAAPRLLPAVVAVALFTVGLTAGLFLLVVPGVWLMVRWYFVAQAVVIEGLGPTAALRRSAELVRGLWWRNARWLLGYFAMLYVIGAIGESLVAQIHAGWLYVTGEIVLRAILLSLSAIFGTLLFFDCRARHQLERAAPTPLIDSAAPERPVPPPGI